MRAHAPATLTAGSLLFIYALLPHARHTPQEEPFVARGAAARTFDTAEAVPIAVFVAAAVRRVRGGVRGGSVVALGERGRKARGATGATRALPIGNVREVPWSLGGPAERGGMAVERRLLESPVVSRLSVAERARTLFCPVDGVASQQFMGLLEEAEGVGKGALPILTDFAVRDRERFLVRPDVFRFVFVRHPFVRALGAYLRGVDPAYGLESDHYREFMADVRGRRLTEQEHELQRLSLLFFLTFLLNRPPSDLPAQFMPHVELCSIGHINYTLVGRLENLAKDLLTVVHRLHLPVATLLPQSGDTNASLTAPEVFKAAKHRSKAAKLYAQDLTTLGYSPTSF